MEKGGSVRETGRGTPEGGGTKAYPFEKREKGFIHFFFEKRKKMEIGRDAIQEYFCLYFINPIAEFFLLCSCYNY